MSQTDEQIIELHRYHMFCSGSKNYKAIILILTVPDDSNSTSMFAFLK